MGRRTGTKTTVFEPALEPATTLWTIRQKLESFALLFQQYRDDDEEVVFCGFGLLLAELAAQTGEVADAIESQSRQRDRLSDDEDE